MVRQSNTTGNLRMAGMCELPVGPMGLMSAANARTHSEPERAVLSCRLGSPDAWKLDFEDRSNGPLEMLAQLDMECGVDVFGRIVLDGHIMTGDIDLGIPESHEGFR